VCGTGLTVTYPADLPEHQSNDVNIRVRLPNGAKITLNFHNNNADWRGVTVFDIEARLAAQGITCYIIEWVQVAGTNFHWQGNVQCGCGQTPSGSSGLEQPFNWDWQYPAPTCEGGLIVTYPADIPADQANDVNIRILLPNGQTRTYNFHNNGGFWSGETHFNVKTHPQFILDMITSYTIVWVQVAGTNYHWTGSVPCV
jgi:hypothetical protein